MSPSTQVEGERPGREYISLNYCSGTAGKLISFSGRSGSGADDVPAQANRYLARDTDTASSKILFWGAHYLPFLPAGRSRPWFIPVAIAEPERQAKQINYQTDPHPVESKIKQYIPQISRIRHLNSKLKKNGAD
jgi:hypothetical protein